MRSPSCTRLAPASPALLASLALFAAALATVALTGAALTGEPASAATAGPRPATACGGFGFGAGAATAPDPLSTPASPCPSAAPFGLPPGVSLAPAQTVQRLPEIYNGPIAARPGHTDRPSTLVLAGIGLGVLLTLGGAVAAWAGRRDRTGHP